MLSTAPRRWPEAFFFLLRVSSFEEPRGVRVQVQEVFRFMTQRQFQCLSDVADGSEHTHKAWLFQQSARRKLVHMCIRRASTAKCICSSLCYRIGAVDFFHVPSVTSGACRCVQIMYRTLKRERVHNCKTCTERYIGSVSMCANNVPNVKKERIHNCKTCTERYIGSVSMCATHIYRALHRQRASDYTT